MPSPSLVRYGQEGPPHPSPTGVAEGLLAGEVDLAQEVSDAAICLTYAGAVVRLCRSRTRSEADAQDAVQDTFVRFLQRLDRDVRNPEAWLIKAAERACQDLHRRWTREGRTRFDGDRPRRASDNPEDAVLSAALLRELFQKLGGKDARLLSSLYVSGWTFEQLSEQMKIPRGRLRVMALRARRRALRTLEAMDQ